MAHQLPISYHQIDPTSTKKTASAPAMTMPFFTAVPIMDEPLALHSFKHKEEPLFVAEAPEKKRCPSMKKGQQRQEGTAQQQKSVPRYRYDPYNMSALDKSTGSHSANTATSSSASTLLTDSPPNHFYDQPLASMTAMQHLPPSALSNTPPTPSTVVLPRSLSQQQQQCPPSAIANNTSASSTTDEPEVITLDAIHAAYARRPSDLRPYPTHESNHTNSFFLTSVDPFVFCDERLLAGMILLVSGVMPDAVSVRHPGCVRRCSIFVKCRSAADKNRVFGELAGRIQVSRHPDYNGDVCLLVYARPNMAPRLLDERMARHWKIPRRPVQVEELGKKATN